MSPSNTWWRARPPALARYIAVSASRNMSSGRSYPALDMAIPTLTLENISYPRTSMGAASSSWIRSATPMASASQLMSSSRTVNSSPPRRASVSPGRRQRSSRRAIPTSSSSPAWCPRLSLIDLNRSRSRYSTANSELPSAAGAVKHVLQPIEEQRAVREIGERIVERPPLQLLLGHLALGDVARDAERPDDVSAAVAQGKLGRRDPADVAVRARLLLLDVHHRLSGADDLLLVAARLRRVFLGEEVEVGPPDRQRRVRDAEAHRRVTVDARETALPILEIDAVGDVVHQRLQEVDLLLKLRDLGDRLPRPHFGCLAAGSHAHRHLVTDRLPNKLRLHKA